jgi:metal-responsive CopG/Arc/MetJ family transcriptional regulator
VKTAISLSDHLFQQAEHAAKTLRISRSKLFSRAIAEFLARNQSAAVTERLNMVYSEIDAKVDPSLQAEQLKLLEKARW